MADPVYESMGYKGSPLQSLVNCGRVATLGPVKVVERLKATVDAVAITATLQHYGMWDQVKLWGTDSWRTSASLHNVPCTDAASFRRVIGENLLREMFAQY